MNQTFIYKNEQQLGPFDDAIILTSLGNGTFEYSDLCWRDGWTNWHPLDTIYPKPQSRVQAKAEKQLGTQLTVHRKHSTTGFLYSVSLVVDGRPVGELKSGVSFTVELYPGVHTIQVAGGGLSKQVSVTVAGDKQLKYETYFSSLGILGGGLILRST